MSTRTTGDALIYDRAGRVYAVRDGVYHEVADGETAATLPAAFALTVRAGFHPVKWAAHPDREFLPIVQADHWHSLIERGLL